MSGQGGVFVLNISHFSLSFKEWPLINLGLLEAVAVGFPRGFYSIPVLEKPEALKVEGSISASSFVQES